MFADVTGVVTQSCDCVVGLNVSPPAAESAVVNVYKTNNPAVYQDLRSVAPPWPSGDLTSAIQRWDDTTPTVASSVLRNCGS